MRLHAMRLLELRHIRGVACVAKNLHFSRAAEELGIAAPSLTKLVQEAERILGVRLFHRTKRSVALTAPGEVWLDQALVALDHLSRGQELALLTQRGELGRIEVGYVASAVYSGALQQDVQNFRKHHPLIEINVREVVMDRVGAMLEDGGLDLAYVRPPMRFPESVAARTVYRDTFVLAIPSGSPLAAFDVVKPAQLRDQVFALPEQIAGTFEVARRGRFEPQLGAQPGTLAAVLACVSLGGNVAIVPSSLTECVALPGVEYRSISGKPIATEIALAFRRFERSATVKSFVSAATSSENTGFIRTGPQNAERAPPL